MTTQNYVLKLNKTHDLTHIFTDILTLCIHAQMNTHFLTDC